MKALGSRLSAIARRRSGLSKGGLPRFTIKLRLMPSGAISQAACGSCRLTSLSSGLVMLYGKLMSNLPAAKARMAVDTFLITADSIPSPYGPPSFQSVGFFANLICAVGLDSAYLH